MRKRFGVVILSLFSAMSFVSAARAQDGASLGVLPYATGLRNPVELVHAGDGTGRLFVVEQRGLVRIMSGGAVASEPFLDIRSLVSCCGERGLLGLAFHPAYEENGFAYVNYTDTSGNTVVARYEVDAADRNRLDPESATTLLRVVQPFANHNGGRLAFGRDGYLYIALGDGGSGGDPDNRAQNINDLLGKILRINVDAGDPYAIPATNPFVGRAGARGEIWAYGLRNPWKFSFDQLTGDLWTADVGQSSWEEVNFQPAASAGGENYGWRRMEGAHCFNPPTGCSDPSLTLPVAEYSRDGGCSVTGGYVYRGRKYPALRGMYLYGDFCSGVIRAVTRTADGGFESQTLLDSGLAISSFGEDESGELYVVSYSGTIYSLVDSTRRRRRAVRRGGS